MHACVSVVEQNNVARESFERTFSAIKTVDCEVCAKHMRDMTDVIACTACGYVMCTVCYNRWRKPICPVCREVIPIRGVASPRERVAATHAALERAKVEATEAMMQEYRMRLEASTHGHAAMPETYWLQLLSEPIRDSRLYAGKHRDVLVPLKSKYDAAVLEEAAAR
jgi:hypothetical protein